MPGRRQGNFLAACVCAAALAFAFYAQYGMDFVPCHLCIFQRFTMAVLGVAFLLAALFSRPGGRGILFAVLIGLAGLATIATSGRHVWIQMQPEGSVPACGADLAFMLDLFPLTDVILKVFKAGGECAKIDWTFLGLSMPAWVLIFAVVLTACGNPGQPPKRRLSVSRKTRCRRSMSSTAQHSSTWWIVRLSSPNSTTSAPSAPKNRPSEVPPPVDSSGSRPATSRTAAVMSDVRAPGAV